MNSPPEVFDLTMYNNEDLQSTRHEGFFPNLTFLLYCLLMTTLWADVYFSVRNDELLVCYENCISASLHELIINSTSG